MNAKLLHPTIGAVLWCIVALIPWDPNRGIGTIEKLFLLGPLVVVPWCIWRGNRLRGGGRRRRKGAFAKAAWAERGNCARHWRNWSDRRAYW